MYGWLPGALEGTATVITANRRLARVLREEYALQQVDAGSRAWRSPRIYAWPDWLDVQLRNADRQEELPTRINHYHSTLLWERSLRKELGEDMTGTRNLVRLARDSWQRLADWNVSIREVARSAQSEDHRTFAAAAGRYLGLLERERWIDDAGLAGLVAKLLSTGRIPTDGSFTFAGIDREKPAMSSVRIALQEAGCTVIDAPSPERSTGGTLQAFATPDAEMRAAGAWARRRLEDDPGQRIAIVAQGLERDAQRFGRLVREGLLPGQRLSSTISGEDLNVSYGCKLADYPAVSIGFLWLRWLVRDLRAREVSQLLLSPLAVTPVVSGRARLEMRLRRLPDRNWSPSMVTAALQSKEEATDAADWLQQVAALTKARRELSASASPAQWAVRIDEVLGSGGWPGKQQLASDEFQLVNRWRDLLNDLARMDLVSHNMTLESALNHLENMAVDAVFQPESETTRVHLLGPLEASGIEFDALWLTGATAAQWPPAGNPLSLVSRRLQQERGMPDAVPEETVAYTTNLLEGLCCAAPDLVCSYPLADEDGDQVPSDLLASLMQRDPGPDSDPGWYAASLVGTAQITQVEDRVPPITSRQSLSGGASTIQNQLTNPIAAFLGGRLGVRPLDVQSDGLPPLLRGNLIHDALYQLYFEVPVRDDVANWTDCEQRIANAVDFAFARHERNADRVLLALFAMERRRISKLLQDFVTLDVSRDWLIVDSVEREVEFEEAGVRLRLRVDRIDRVQGGGIAILDYKTGAEKKFLTSKGDPREIQLVAYACAVDEPVAALALVNVDSRAIGFSGAGAGYTDTEIWPQQLAAWSDVVRNACAEMTAGDVRIDLNQAVEDARPLNLLSRFTELRSEV